MPVFEQMNAKIRAATRRASGSFPFQASSSTSMLYEALLKLAQAQAFLSHGTSCVASSTPVPLPSVRT